MIDEAMMQTLALQPFTHLMLIALQHMHSSYNVSYFLLSVSPILLSFSLSLMELIDLTLVNRFQNLKDILFISFCQDLA